MSHQGLGEFEQMVLLAIVHLEGEVYGSSANSSGEIGPDQSVRPRIT